MDINKGGRPRVSRVLEKAYTDKKSYNKAYQTEFRYVFTVNLSQEKDTDIIEAIETLAGGNRQKAVKILLRAGIQQLKNNS